MFLGVEIIFSFDTTKSMFACLSTVRVVIKDALQRLVEKIPGIKIGILAHGDYCDSYITSAANNFKFCSSTDIDKLIDFVLNVKATNGGDFPECYELVLRQVRTKFNWSSNANKSLVLIGDAIPHLPFDNPERIDWREEARALKEKNIKVYAVQALDHKISFPFYQELSQLTMGFHLRLHQFSTIVDFLTAACCNEAGCLDLLEEEIQCAGRMIKTIAQLFDKLKGRTSVETKAIGTLIPCSPCRFQVLTVDKNESIKSFAENRGLIFKVGRGFYEFTKPEIISEKKEIVLMEKSSGDFYTGKQAARELAGIRIGDVKRQKPLAVDKYVVFVQSSSYNRKLIAGQRFLYEVDTSH